MSNSVGVAELRQNLSKYLKRVAAGERLVVTDHNKPVAQLGPPPQTRFEELIAEGKIKPPRRTGPLPEPLPLAPGEDPNSISRALEEVRGYRPFDDDDS